MDLQYRRCQNCEDGKVNSNISIINRWIKDNEYKQNNKIELF